VFRKWAFGLPTDIDVCAIDYPGRGSRLREPRFTRLDDLVHHAARALQPLLDRPFAVVGYSLGAWVGFEWLRRHALSPDRFIVLSCRAPHLVSPHAPLHALDDAALVKTVQERYAGIPAAILREPEWLAMLLPVLRDDLQVVETYDCQPGARLTCPIDAHGGDADPTLTTAMLQAWGTHTTGVMSTRQWAGGHFFAADHEKALWHALLACWPDHVASTHG